MVRCESAPRVLSERNRAMLSGISAYIDMFVRINTRSSGLSSDAARRGARVLTQQLRCSRMNAAERYRRCSRSDYTDISPFFLLRTRRSTGQSQWGPYAVQGA